MKNLFQGLLFQRAQECGYLINDQLLCVSVCMRRILQSRVCECVQAKNILVFMCVSACMQRIFQSRVCECVHAKNVQSIWLCEPQGGGYLGYRQCTETVVNRQQEG